MVVGMVIGFGIASKVSRIPELEKQIQQHTQENADLKAKLSVPVTPAVSGTSPNGHVRLARGLRRSQSSL